MRRTALSVIPILFALMPSRGPAAQELPAAPASSPDPYETLLGEVESEQGLARVLHLLDTALKQPVNLLAADRDQIGRLPWVSPRLADEIVTLRASGGLRTLEDLKRIPGVTNGLVDRLKPFVILRPLEKRQARAAGLVRLRVVASPPSSSAAKLKTNGVCELETGSLRFGIVADKDKGEKRLNDYQAGYVEKAWGAARVTAGNFYLASGHGLVFSDASGESPSTADPWRIGRGNFGIRTSTGSEENFLAEGVGIALAAKAVDLCVALSRATFDVSLDDNGRVTSLNETGSHVTATEREGQDALREDLVGVACRLRGRGLAMTASLAGSSLNRDFVVAGIDRPKHQARLQGGLDLSIQQGDALVFAEGALDGSGGALLGGLALDRPQAEALILGRTCDTRYLSLHSRPFGFYSGVGTGEQGLLTLVKFKPISGGEISIGNDLHRRERRGSAFRASGSETFADLTIDAGAFVLSLGEKLAKSQEPPSVAAAATGSESIGTEETVRLRSRLDVRYTPVRGARLRARYEVLSAGRRQAGAGSRWVSDVARLDLSLDGPRRLRLDAGCYVFSVDGWPARSYQYEAGLPYYPTLELLKSDGSRWYAVVSWDTKSLGKMAAKFGRTVYADGEDDSQFLAAYILRM